MTRHESPDDKQPAGDGRERAPDDRSDQMARIIGEQFFQARLPQIVAELADHPERANPQSGLSGQAVYARSLMVGWANEILERVIRTPGAQAAEGQVDRKLGMPQEYGQMHFVVPEVSGQVGDVSSFTAQVRHEPVKGRNIHEIDLAFAIDVKVLFGAEAFLKQADLVSDLSTDQDPALQGALTNILNDAAATQVDVEGRPFQCVKLPTSVEISVFISGRSYEGFDRFVIAVHQGSTALFQFSLYPAGDGGLTPYVDFKAQLNGSPSEESKGGSETIGDIIRSELEAAIHRDVVPVISEDFRTAGQIVLSIQAITDQLVQSWIVNETTR